MSSELGLLKRKLRDPMEPRAGKRPAPPYLWTKLQVPSMGSMIQVGLWVSTHLAPEAVASSAMNLLGQGAQPESVSNIQQECACSRHKALGSSPSPKTPPPPPPRNQSDFLCDSFGGTQGSGAGRAEMQESRAPERAQIGKQNLVPNSAAVA